MMVTIGMIPARYASSRFNGKVLADIAGKPMVQHVYERASKAKSLQRVIIATDDARVAEMAAGFGAEVAMTSPDHASGTDRLAEVARQMACDLVVNIQGDEPLIEPAIIDRAVEPLLREADVRMATLATPVSGPDEHDEPSAVKVVCDARGNALYFSRLPVPYFRIDDATKRKRAMAERVHPDSAFRPLKHIGLYVYRRDTLIWFAGLARTPLEITEGLEQLRALENGCPIRVTVVDYSPVGVDTPEDLERVRALLEAGQ